MKSTLVSIAEIMKRMGTKMPQFEFEVIRRYYITDTVKVVADDFESAEKIMLQNQHAFLKEIPKQVYESLQFEDIEFDLIGGFDNSKEGGS